MFISSCDNSEKDKKYQDAIIKINDTFEEKIKIINENNEKHKLQFENEQASQKIKLEEIKKRLDESVALVKQLRKEMWTEAVDNEAFKKYKLGLEVPALQVHLVEKSPLMDGQLDELYKKHATSMGFYPIQILKPNRTEKTDITAYVLMDKKALYIITRVETSVPVLMYSDKPRDSELWKSDCIDIFIDPSGDGSEYYHIITNAAGSLYDAKQSDTSWNPGIVIKLGIEKEKAWIMEMKIPLSDIGVKLSEIKKTWSFNINHFKPNEEEEVPDVDLAWSPTGSDSSHVPEMFGKLWMSFAGRPKSKKD